MDGSSIAQAAERTGFSASALRFYEQAGLVRPGRTPAGYRSYSERDLELLGFIRRAKGFGLSLREIADVLTLLDDERCQPVQTRLRDLVDAKVLDAQDRIAELVAFTVELRRVAEVLRQHTPDGPCDRDCGCAADLDRAPVGPAVACTLAPDQIGERVAEWQTTLARGAGREPIDGGVRVRFSSDHDVDLLALASLAAAEQDCCRFLTFGLTIGHDGVVLDITGPPDAEPVIDTLVGSVS